MKVTPIRDTVVIQPEPLEEKTAGGIFVPRTAKNRAMRGKVISVGPGRILESGVRIEPEYKAGDTVIYATYNAAQGVAHADDESGHIMLHDLDIMAIVEP